MRRASMEAPEVGPSAVDPRTPRSQRERLTGRILWGLAFAFFMLSLLQLSIVPQRFLDAFERAQHLIQVMFPPRIENPPNLFAAAIESIQIAIVGTVFGIVLSIILAVLAARNVSPLGPLSVSVKLFAGFVRSMPALIWAILFIVAVGLGPAAGILALAVNSTGMLVKIYSETIEEIPPGPLEALRATGANRTQLAFQGILPQVAGVFIAWSVFRFDINVRYSAVLGIVGAGGIGWEVIRATNLLRFDVAMGVTMVIFAMVVAMEMLSRWLQKRSDFGGPMM